MGKVEAWIHKVWADFLYQFPIVRERDIQRKVIDTLANEIKQRDEHVDALRDQLAAMHVRAIAAETKLIQRQEPAPLEPVTIKAGTAADVRRIMAEQSRKDLEDTDDIR